ncbi:unnamed protein product [Agarophyton chilense]
MGAVGGIGAKMLYKMGWTEGTGLGRNRDGVVNPLVHKRRPQALGIGAEERPFQDAWWEKMLESAYGTPAKTVDDESLFKASDGRRCRPHGTAKLARLDAHDKESSGKEKEAQKAAQEERVGNEQVETKSKKELKRERKKRERKLEAKRSIKLKLLEKGISKKRKERQKDTVMTQDKLL